MFARVQSEAAPICSILFELLEKPPSPTQNAALLAPVRHVAFGCFQDALTLVNPAERGDEFVTAYPDHCWVGVGAVEATRASADAAPTTMPSQVAVAIAATIRMIRTSSV